MVDLLLLFLAATGFLFWCIVVAMIFYIWIDL